MEPTEKKVRIVLSLGKFRVLYRDNKCMKIALGGSTTMTVPVQDYMDVQSGDVLTLYTEVYYAKPKSTPVQ